MNHNVKKQPQQVTHSNWFALRNELISIPPHGSPYNEKRSDEIFEYGILNPTSEKLHYQSSSKTQIDQIHALQLIEDNPVTKCIEEYHFFHGVEEVMAVVDNNLLKITNMIEEANPQLQSNLIKGGYRIRIPFLNEKGVGFTAQIFLSGVLRMTVRTLLSGEEILKAKNGYIFILPIRS